MGLTFHTLDVFTHRAYCGNPLGVVLDAEELDKTAMQLIAAEFNLSETVFVTAPKNPSFTAAMKIFTPACELPFAGHPTIGTAILLAELKYGVEEEREAIILLEQGVGPVRVGVIIRPGETAYAEFDLPKMPRELDPPADRDAVARAIGLNGSDIGFDNHRPTNFSAGVPFALVPVRDPDALARATPIVALWTGAEFGASGHRSVFVYTRHRDTDNYAFEARMFAPKSGILEDAATGSAVAALAGALEKFESLATGLHVVPVQQGAQMGRPSRITLEVGVEAGRLKTARIGGRALRMTQGTLVP